MIDYKNGQPIWLAGMNKKGGYSKQARKAIFNRYINDNCCIVTYADVKFRKNGIDSHGITCLLSNISPRDN